MACGNKADAALRKRVHDVDVLLPRNAEDIVHALVFQAVHQELGCVMRVATVLLSEAFDELAGGWIDAF